MRISFEEKINHQLNDESLTSSFQPGQNGEISAYAQSKVAEFYAEIADRQSQFTAYSQDGASATA